MRLWNIQIMNKWITPSKRIVTLKTLGNVADLKSCFSLETVVSNWTVPEKEVALDNSAIILELLRFIQETFSTLLDFIQKFDSFF